MNNRGATIGLLVLAGLCASCGKAPVQEPHLTPAQVDQQIARLLDTEPNALQSRIRQLSPELMRQLASRGKKQAELYSLVFLHYCDKRDDELREELQALRAKSLPQGKALGFNDTNYPNVNGSTSTEPLAKVIAAGLTDRQYGWSQSHPDLSYGDREIEVAERHVYLVETDEERRSGTKLLLNTRTHFGTHEAYDALMERKCDLILVARGPSEGERAWIRLSGHKLDVQPVALDALVFLVSPSNPAKSLTQQQIQRIYREDTPYWNDYGGNWVPIYRYGRDADSGSFTLWEGKVFKTRSEQWQTDGTGDKMSSVYDQLAKDDSTLTYSVYYYARYIAISPLARFLAVDGVLPTHETIANRTYPYTAEVFVVIHEDLPADHPARRLRDWLLSAEGQQVVAESGYVPIGGV